MNNEELELVTTCLDEKYTYPYFKDKYAIELLTYQLGKEERISDIKKSKFGALLNKKLINEQVAKCGNGVLIGEQLTYSWNDQTHYFRITLGEWGNVKKRKSNTDFNQVSRPQKNLVVQLNFGSEHDLIFYDKIGKEYKYEFANDCHPIHNKFNTLGWVRLDVDLENDEVLIEEVQSDWIRDVIHIKKQIENGAAYGENRWYRRHEGAVKQYLNHINPILKIWDEALLSSAIWMIKNELGISKIWYHTFESSKHYKIMRYSLPPRSLYSSLPERFMFTRVKETPGLILRCEELKRLSRKGKNLEFYKLDLGCMI
jgi:hypothetical protein